MSRLTQRGRRTRCGATAALPQTWMQTAAPKVSKDGRWSSSWWKPTGPGTIQIEVADAPSAALPDIYGGEETRGPGRKVLKVARPLFSDAVDLACRCAAEVRQRVEQMPAGTQAGRIRDAVRGPDRRHRGRVDSVDDRRGPVAGQLAVAGSCPVADHAAVRPPLRPRLAPERAPQDHPGGASARNARRGPELAAGIRHDDRVASPDPPACLRGLADQKAPPGAGGGNAVDPAADPAESRRQRRIQAPETGETSILDAFSVTRPTSRRPRGWPS